MLNALAYVPVLNVIQVHLHDSRFRLFKKFNFHDRIDFKVSQGI